LIDATVTQRFICPLKITGAAMNLLIRGISQTSLFESCQKFTFSAHLPGMCFLVEMVIFKIDLMKNNYFNLFFKNNY